MLFTQVLPLERLCASPSEFSLEFVGDGAMLEVELAATCRIDRGLGVVIIPVSGYVTTCQVISVHIELLLKGQFVIQRVFVSMPLDVNKGQCVSE